MYEPVYSSLPVSDSYIESNALRFGVGACGSVGYGIFCDMRGHYENMSINEWAAQHLVAIEISFRDNKVEVWETRPAMTPVDLLSSVGGTMGLYLGISVVTVFEVIDFLIGVCRSYCTYCVNKRD